MPLVKKEFTGAQFESVFQHSPQQKKRNNYQHGGNDHTPRPFLDRQIILAPTYPSQIPQIHKNCQATDRMNPSRSAECASE